MKHAKNVAITKDSKGNPVNVITTERGYLVKTYSVDYPKTDEYIQIVDMILGALEDATITLDPQTNTIKIQFARGNV